MDELKEIKCPNCGSDQFFSYFRTDCYIKVICVCEYEFQVTTEGHTLADVLTERMIQRSALDYFGDKIAEMGIGWLETKKPNL